MFVLFSVPGVDFPRRLGQGPLICWSYTFRLPGRCALADRGRGRPRRRERERLARPPAALRAPLTTINRGS